MASEKKSQENYFLHAWRSISLLEWLDLTKFSLSMQVQWHNYRKGYSYTEFMLKNVADATDIKKWSWFFSEMIHPVFNEIGPRFDVGQYILNLLYKYIKYIAKCKRGVAKWSWKERWMGMNGLCINGTW